MKKMMQFELMPDRIKESNYQAMKLITMYADALSWKIYLALFRDYTDDFFYFIPSVNLVFDWQKLVCHQNEGRENIETFYSISTFISIKELLKAEVAKAGDLIGSVYDAVVDEEHFEIEELLINPDITPVLNKSERTIIIRTEKCIWHPGGKGKPYIIKPEDA